MGANAVADHAPHAQLVALEQVPRRVLRVGRAQHYLALLDVIDLHQRLMIEFGDDNLARLRHARAVDDQDVGIVDAGADHAMPGGPGQEGVRGADIHQLVEGNRPLDVILGWAGKAGWRSEERRVGKEYRSGHVQGEVEAYS